MQIDEGVDVLNPEVRLINGSCYRVLCPPAKMAKCGSSALRSQELCSQYSNVYEDEPSTCKAIKKENESNKEDWRTAELPTPSHFHKYIVGKGRTVQKRLENETGTQIHVPRPHEKKNSISVRYKTDSSLSSIEVRVESIVMAARKRERPTHFLSIPIGSSEITSSLAKFQDLCGDKIRPHKVQFPSKLHLTLGVLKLFSEQEIKQACEALKEFAPRIPYILCGKPLRGSLKKLEIMNDDPQSVNVLYGELHLLDESDRLQNLADQCFQFFVEKGLMDLEQNRNSQSVKLHCTLINTRWNNDGPRTIDATDILSDDFELQVFGNCVLEKLELNEMTIDRNMKYVGVLTVPLV